MSDKPSRSRARLRVPGEVAKRAVGDWDDAQQDALEAVKHAEAAPA